MLFNQSASTNRCAHRLDKLQRQEDQERFHQIQEAYKVLLDASKRAMYDVEVSPSHPHPVDSFRSRANICCQMARRVTKMQQYVIMMKQDTKPTMEEMDSIIMEIKACSPLSWSSRSDARTGGAGPHKAVRNVAIAHSAANKH
ncbi:hypothetical protein PAHAL_4G047700 [Panicum hallii]|uniref:J domain-containing protein n=1 Tax=Panicum hallii TaxID=206008 RepID=A0A2S3HH68_9POAL|nr:uncharacterized protein LOC112888405 [Panicum hallii]PAN22830.1 hypothetical protein PAHAL_4G047700 [Panicum hallii]